MGFTPQQVNAMTFYEFACCAAGYSRANGGERPNTYPTDEEFEDAVARLH